MKGPCKKSPLHILGAILLAVTFLSASVSALALSASAPPSAPTSQATPDRASVPAQPPAETASPAPEQARPKAASDSSGENDLNIYRHSPMVQSIAHMLRLPVETTARIFEILNFLVLALTILWFVLRAMPKILRDRAQHIQKDLLNARKATEDANQRLQDVEQRLARLDSEIADLKVQAERETVADDARIRASMEGAKQRMLHEAEQEVLSMSANAQRRLKTLTADLIVQYATQHIAPATDVDRALVRDFVSGLDKKDRKDEGVN